MPDFLSRLAARALGRAPLVQPVIPSVFAPGPRLRHDVAADPAASEPAGALDTAAWHDGPVDSGPASVPRDLLPDVAAPAAGRAAPSRDDASATVRTAAAGPLRATAARTRRRPARGDSAAVPEAAAGPARTGLRTSEPQEIRPAAIAETHRSAAASGAAAGGHEPGGLPAAPRQPGPPGQPALPGQPAVPRQPAPPRQAAVPRQPVVLDRPREPSVPGQQPPAPPRIVITIGRVEVRAVPPPAPPSPRSAAGHARPPLTLEEYARRRQRRP